MRLAAVVALVLSAFVMSGCVTVIDEPTPAPTPAVTDPPTAAPTLPPTEPPPPVHTHAPTPTLAPGQTPLPTAMDLTPFLTSGVTLTNLGDSTLYVTVTGIDPDTSEEFGLGVYEIAPEQFTRQAAIPLLLRFDFTFDQSSVAAAGSCTMVVQSEDELQFLAVGAGVAIIKNSVEPDDLAEMRVATSSQCAVPQ